MAKSTSTPKNKNTTNAPAKNTNACSLKEALKTIGKTLIEEYTAYGTRLYLNECGEHKERVNLTLSTHDLINPKGKVIEATRYPSTIANVQATIKMLMDTKDDSGSPICTFVQNVNAGYFRTKVGYKFKITCTPDEFNPIFYNITSIKVVQVAQLVETQ